MDGVGVFGVREREIEEHPDVSVVQPVVRDPATAAYRDHSMRAQQAEGVRGRGLAQPADGSQIAHAQLTVEQCHQQPQPTRIREQTEHVRGVDDVVLGGHSGSHVRDPFRVDQPDGTALEPLHL